MTTKDAIERVQSMIAPGQQSWDLSPNDIEALLRILLKLNDLREACRRAHGAMHRRLEGMELTGQEMEDIERALAAALR